MEHPFLAGFSAALAEAGYACVRFDFPYRQAGRRMPGPASHAIATWEAIATECRRRFPDVPFVAAGKSYGGRMASMAAAERAAFADALCYLGYPLHLPRNPEKLRAEHLPQIAEPQLFLSGTADPFVQPVILLEDTVASCPAATLEWVTGGGHSFEVAGQRRSAETVGASLAPLVASWLSDVLTSRS